MGHWDVARLERVVSNLLGNALTYSPPTGGIDLELNREDDGEGSRTVLRVRDRGIGIPTDEMARDFERFYRGRNVVGKIAGAGIGLAGARQIVEQHGGTIEVESQEGRGSTFTVRLPLGLPAAEP